MAGVLAWAAVLALFAAGCGGASKHRSARQSATPPGRAVPPPVRVPALRTGQTLVAAVERRAALRRSPRGGVIGAVGPHTAFGSPQVLAVLGVSRGWAHVLHPSAPDGSGAWIAVRNVRLRPAAWTIEVDLSKRRARLLRDGRLFRAFTVGIGAPATPTPTGTFGVTDKLSAGPASSYYGCCVLALSGHQPNVPQHWAGGDRLAFHGTDRPATIGAAATLGCLHTDDATMRALVSRVPLGATVVIHR
jgi:lipoprotein-anchoring transpeptidase ErfK/SrfK